VLLRLGEMIAQAECCASLARRAAAAQGGALHPKAVTRFEPAALAAMARVFARETALAVGEGGIRIAIGAGAETPPSTLASVLDLSQIHSAQAGLLADMDRVADALYGRSAGTPAAPDLPAAAALVGART
jgi:alkylation response protein AidB-like acyl-CoA dehydrogenase